MPRFRAGRSAAPPPPGPRPGEAPTAADATGTDVPDRVLADVATSLWRATRKLDGSGGADAGAAGGVGRHVQAATQALESAGIAVQDHDGTAFDPGLALEVIAYEPRAEVAAETVLETVRPCVYRSGRRIQIGQVIVAQPESRRRRASSRK